MIGGRTDRNSPYRQSRLVIIQFPWGEKSVKQVVSIQNTNYEFKFKTKITDLWIGLVISSSVKVSWRQPVFKTLLFIASNTIPLLVGLCKFKDFNLAGCWKKTVLLGVWNDFKLWRAPLPRGVLQRILAAWERARKAKTNFSWSQKQDELWFLFLHT